MADSANEAVSSPKRYRFGIWVAIIVGIAALLSATPDYDVTVVDVTPAALAGLKAGPQVQRLTLDNTDPLAL